MRDKKGHKVLKPGDDRVFVEENDAKRLIKQYSILFFFLGAGAGYLIKYFIGV